MPRPAHVPTFVAVLALLLWAPAEAAHRRVAAAPDPGVIASSELEQATDWNALNAALTRLRAASTVSSAQKAQADRMRAEAVTSQSTGHGGEAQRQIRHAAALLSGTNWDANAQYAASLDLQLPALIADTALPLTARVTQRFAADPPAAPLRLELVLVAADGTTRLSSGFDLPARDLVAEPLHLDLDVRGLAAGRYQLRAVLQSESAMLGSYARPLLLVPRLAERAAAVESALATGNWSTTLQATVRYPYELARAINGWRRALPADMDLDGALLRSDQLLAQLRDGQDAATRAVGYQERAYWSAASGEYLPYSLFVPANWDHSQALSVALVLHGEGEAMASWLVSAQADKLRALADKYQLMLVFPSGVRPDLAFGANVGRRSTERGDLRYDLQVDARNLSEQDAIAVLDQVLSEYGANHRRVFLLGSGNGGAGVWHLAERYPERFAALAPCSATLDLSDYDFSRLSGLPVRIVSGARDNDFRREQARTALSRLRAVRGGNVSAYEVANAAHPDACLAKAADLLSSFSRTATRATAVRAADAARSGGGASLAASAPAARASH